MFALPIAASAALVLAADVPQTAGSTSGATSPAKSTADLTVSVSGFRNDKGIMQYCIAPAGAAFPKCAGVGVLTGSEAIIGHTAAFVVHDLPKGNYAIAVYHDQNRSRRLDTVMGIPREGYGFSRNPPFKPRAPSFNEAVINLDQNTNIKIRMRYLF